MNRLVKIITDDEGEHSDGPQYWHAVHSFGGSPSVLCDGMPFGLGESGATYEEKQSARGITCPACIAHCHQVRISALYWRNSADRCACLLSARRNCTRFEHDLVGVDRPNVAGNDTKSSVIWVQGLSCDRAWKRYGRQSCLPPPLYWLDDRP